ncbi:MAG TPA: hypothetical protein VGG29_03730 [Caulobacteraceae bacterium]
MKEFVAPPLKRRDDLSTETPRIILVSAPAAVGKSTLAREIAADLHAPLWNLSIAPSIGGAVLDGQLRETFGRAGAATFLENLEAGNASLIIDALDEARIRVTDATFADFLKSVADTAKNSTRASIIILGRRRIIEDAWLHFAEYSCGVDVFEVLYFDKTRSVSFLDNYVSRYLEEHPERLRNYHSAYISARDAIITAIEAVIPGSESESFIGYAPVLMAIARSISGENNFQALASKWQLRDGSINIRPIEIVKVLIEDILIRDQQKLLDNLDGTLKRHLEEAGSMNVYSPGEQVARVFSRLTGHAFDVLPPVSNALRADYEEAVERFLPDHPFITEEGSDVSNPIFLEYVIARTLVAADASQAASIAAVCLTQVPTPTHLVLEFYDAMRGAGLTPVHYIELLYASALGGEAIDYKVFLTLESVSEYNSVLRQHESFIETEIEFVNQASDAPSEPRTLKFRTSLEDGAVVSFSRALSNSSIEGEIAVRLTSPTEEFEFIGDVSIECQVVEFAVSSITVRNEKAEKEAGETVTGTWIRAGRAEGQPQRPPQVFGTLNVDWPTAGVYPWQKYYKPFIPNPKYSYEELRTFDILRKILTAFRSHKKGALARYRGKIESDRVSRGEMGKNLLHSLVEAGILQLRGSFYFIDSERLSTELNMSYYDFKERAFTEETLKYVDRFLERQRAT